jgi:hypothetical protein
VNASVAIPALDTGAVPTTTPLTANVTVPDGWPAPGATAAMVAVISCSRPDWRSQFRIRLTVRTRLDTLRERLLT